MSDGKKLVEVARSGAVGFFQGLDEVMDERGQVLATGHEMAEFLAILESVSQGCIELIKLTRTHSRRLTPGGDA